MRHLIFKSLLAVIFLSFAVVAQAQSGKLTYGFSVHGGGISFQVGVMNGNGSEAVAYDCCGLKNVAPRWSPDGSQIAFIQSSTTSTNIQDIWVMSAGGTNRRALTTDGGYKKSPVWSRDGQWIYYSTLYATAENPVGIYRVSVSNPQSPALVLSTGRSITLNDFSPDGKQMLFIQGETSFISYLWIADANGSNPHRLTNSEKGETDGRWSADGNKIVYSLNLSSGFTESFQICSVQPDGSGFTELTPYVDGISDLAPVWSPDGSQIAFLSDRQDNQSDLWKIDADGSNPVLLTPHTENQLNIYDSVDWTDSAPPSLSAAPVTINEGNSGTSTVTVLVQLKWAPDQPVTLSYTTAPGTANSSDFIAKTGTISLAAGQTSATFNVKIVGDTTKENDEWFRVIFSSPQNVSLFTSEVQIGIVNDDYGVSRGGQIVFASSRDGDMDIYIMNGDGSNQRQLTNYYGSDDDPDLSKDGKWVAFKSGAGAPITPGLYIMSSEGGTPRLLVSGMSNLARPRFSPDGSKVAFVAYDGHDQEIYLVDAAGGTPTPLTVTDGWEQFPVWRPDGKALLFEGDDANGTNDIFSIDVNGTNLTNLTNTPNSSETTPAVSPDGTMFAFRSNRGNCQSGVYLRDINGTNERWIPNTGTAENSVFYFCFSPDSKRLAFSNYTTVEVWTVNLDGTVKAPLNMPANGYNPSWQSSGSPAPTYSISGRCVNFAPNAAFSASTKTNLSGVTVSLKNSTNTLNLSTTSDTTGAYSFSNLPAGDYTLSGTLNGATLDPPTRSVTISTANVAAPRLSLYSLFGVVKVTNSAGQTLPRAGVVVTLGNPSSAIATRTTGTDGRFNFGKLPAGKYTLWSALSGFTFPVKTPLTLPATTNVATPALKQSITGSKNTSSKSTLR